MKTIRKRNTWWIKFSHFEYWNWISFYIPLIPLWLELARRAKCLTYFTVVNPAVAGGGFLYEDKWNVLELLPPELVPMSHFQLCGTAILHKPKVFPIIVKPVQGQRGRGVTKIFSLEELLAYHKNAPEDYIIQEYVDSTYEYAVFYSRIPGEKEGIVSSITQKVFMKVTGDGCSSIEELMSKDYRFMQQVERLSKHLDLKVIPPNGTEVLLEPIGNHCRGTTFIDARHLINADVQRTFNTIMNQVPNFYYGRFDLRADSPESLETGRGLHLLELNGVTGDVAHIFHPGYSLFQAYKDVWWHWKRMAKIAKKNIENGHEALPVKKVWKDIKSKFGW